VSDEQLPPLVRSAGPDRLRLDVPAIRAQPLLAAALEAAVWERPHVTKVKANATTGGVLITFGPEVDADELVAHVGASLRRLAATQGVPSPRRPGALRQILGRSLPARRRERVTPFVWTVATHGQLVAQGFFLVSVINVVRGTESSMMRLIGVRGMTRQVNGLIFGSIALVIGEQWMQNYREASWRRLRLATEHNLRAEAFRHMESLDMEYFDERGTGPLISLLADEVDKVGLILEGTDKFVQSVMTIAAASYVFIRASPRLALCAAVAIPFLALPSRLLGKRTGVAFGAYAETKGAMMRVLESVLAGIPEIKSFTTEELEAQRVDEAAEAADRGSLGALRTSTAQSTSTRAIFQVGFLATIRYGASLGAAGKLGPDRVIAALWWFPILLQAGRDILLLSDPYYGGKAAATSLLELLETAPRYGGGSARLETAAVRGEVVLDDVSFGYDPEQPVLHDVSLRIEAGSTVGIVGPTGSGKSTLLWLLLGFYYPDGGRVLLDGRDIRELDVRDVRHAMALVSQDIYLFDDTLEANIRYGRRDAPDDDVAAAMAVAQLDDVAMILRAGSESTVGERGGRLSGGQRQRAGIARAIVKESPILLLDEATSQLDNSTEARMRDLLSQATVRRTTVLVAHRLASVRHADKIVVLDLGRVREHGTHEQLLAQRGLYYELWQARG
jgi:ATP-binding cassette subfamily B protein